MLYTNRVIWLPRHNQVSFSVTNNKIDKIRKRVYSFCSTKVDSISQAQSTSTSSYMFCAEYIVSCCRRTI